MKKNILSIYQEAIDHSIDKLAEKILKIARLSSVNPIIIYRVKDLNTLKIKMALKQKQSILEIEDVYGFRILVSNIGEVYAVLLAIGKFFDGYIDHDYIKTPKTRPDKPHLKNKSLRLLQFIAYVNDIPIEVQITTHKFNKENESLHKGYHLEKYT